MHKLCIWAHSITSAAQGREREWLFAEAEGQWEVARQCAARRLLIVALGRGHAFASLAAVQAELSPLVAPLSRGRTMCWALLFTVCLGCEPVLVVQ